MNVVKNTHQQLIETISEGQTILDIERTIVLEEGATLEHILIQPQLPQGKYLAKIHVTQHANSHYRVFVAGCGIDLAHVNIQVRLQGEHAKAELNGFYKLDQQQQFTIHTEVYHDASHTQSTELFKGVVGGKAKAEFRGRVIVPKHVKNIEAAQTNKNLLLSLGAEIKTQPELQIDSDAVKCSHGATVGQLDQEALFCLKARGISEAEAKKILIEAFLAELMDHPSSGALHHLLPQGEKGTCSLTGG